MNPLNQNHVRIFLAIFSFFVLSRCSPQNQISLPTMDQSTIVAAVVETVNAQNTQNAYLIPSETPLPTETIIPPTATLILSTETPTQTPQPTETPTEQLAYSAILQYVAAYPEDKREYVGNERFGIAIGFLNSGTITWESGSVVRLVSYSGEPTVQLEAVIPRAVPPGDKVEFNFWAFGSEWYGDHTFIFQLYNSQGLSIPGGYATFTYTSV